MPCYLIFIANLLKLFIHARLNIHIVNVAFMYSCGVFELGFNEKYTQSYNDSSRS